jgi:bile acid-coenzyme A ligase
MVDRVAPMSTQISTLARAAPDAPAVTCGGRTLTRAELDASTNRLARAYAELGVGVGDYVSIAMPNSIEWIQVVIACWKLGAVPQPLSARLPDAEFIGILDLKPRALIVGRADPRGEVPSVQRISRPVRPSPTRHCQRRCPRCGSR